jgi:hypothetical protein
VRVLQGQSNLNWYGFASPSRIGYVGLDADFLPLLPEHVTGLGELEDAPKGMNFDTRAAFAMGAQAVALGIPFARSTRGVTCRMPPSATSSYSRFFRLRQLFFSRQYIASGRFERMDYSPAKRPQSNNESLERTTGQGKGDEAQRRRSLQDDAPEPRHLLGQALLSGRPGSMARRARPRPPAASPGWPHNSPRVPAGRGLVVGPGRRRQPSTQWLQRRAQESARTPDQVAEEILRSQLAPRHAYIEVVEKPTGSQVHEFR